MNHKNTKTQRKTNYLILSPCVFFVFFSLLCVFVVILSIPFYSVFSVSLW